MPLTISRKVDQSITIRDPDTGRSIVVRVEKIAGAKSAGSSVKLALVDPSKSFRVVRTEAG